MGDGIRGGFIVWARKAFHRDSWLWNLSHVHFRVAIYLAAQARWKDEPMDLGHTRVGRSQLFTSYEKIARDCSVPRNPCTVKQGRVAVRKLEKEGYLQVEERAGFGLLLTLTNYDVYQTLENYSGQGAVKPKGRVKRFSGQASGQRKKEGKKEGKKKEKSSPSPPETPKTPPKPRKRSFADDAHDSWSEKYAGPPPWGKAEYANLARARKRVGDENLVRVAWGIYLEDRDPFYEGHDPKKFVGTLSRWVALARKRGGGCSFCGEPTDGTLCAACKKAGRKVEQ